MTRSLESLFERYRRRGEVSALAKIFDRTAPELLRIAMHLVRDPAVAEDLLQETFVAAMESAERFDASQRLVPWLAGILSNQARRHHRSTARQPDPTRLHARGEASGVGELEANVAQGIDALPARYRQIVLLKLGYGMEPAAIAHLLDVPPATVRTRLHRGLEQLRGRLPAGLVLGALPPAAALRGLEGIREAVVSHASASAVTTTVVATAALWTLGGVVVTKANIAGALILLGLVLVGGVFTLGDWSAGSSDTGETPGLHEADADEGPALQVREGAGKEQPPEEATEPEDAEPTDRHVWRASGHVVADEKRVPGAYIEAWIERGSVIMSLPAGAADAAGRYTLDLKVIKAWSDLERASATLMVRARAPGYRPGQPTRFPLVEHADIHAPEGDLELEPGFSIEGRVVDARGEPVARAGVSLHRVPHDGADWYAYTDTDGHYAVGTEDAGTYAVAVRSSQGTGRSEARAIALRESVTLPDVVLSEGLFIRGRVVSADGTPLPGVDLFANALPTADGTQPPREAGNHQLRARTDADGGFRLFSLWDGRFRIHVSGLQATTDAAMGEHEVLIRILAPVMVTRVVGPEGRPLPGAGVSLLGWRGKHVDIVDQILAGTVTLETARAVSSSSSYSTLLSADGTLTDFVTPGSRWIVSARVVGAPPAETTVRIDGSESVTRVNLVIHPAIPHGRLDLRVLKPDGSQLKDFEVEISTPLGMGVGSSRSNANGELLPVESGSLRLRVLPFASTNYMARRFGLGTFLLPGTAAVEVPPNGRGSATVKLREGGRFRLRLTYPEGEQPKTESLRIRLFERGHADAPFQYGGRWVYDEPKGLHVTSVFHPAEACLNAKLLAPDDYRLEVRTQKHGTHDRTIRIRAGEVIDVVMDLRK